ncbi:MAG: hypothetical protein Q7J55_04625 [bacterium]|nr:hypothetical protein [bacterium]
MGKQNNIKILWEYSHNNTAKQRLVQVFDIIFDKVQESKERESKKNNLTNQKVCDIFKKR